MAGEDRSVADLGEWGVIAALRARMPAGPLTSVGIGDDAAVVGAPSGSVVAAVDMMIEGRHFRLGWSSAYDIGAKSAARSLADIAAMGAVNTALLVALAAPGALPARWAGDLAEGLAAEAARAGAGVVGGDTARADLVTLSVTALGDLEGRAPVLRSGARPGDVVAVAGPLGHSAAGLALLAAGMRPATASAPGAARPGASGPGGSGPGGSGPGAQGAVPGAGVLADLVTAHVRPAPPYDAGPEAARLGATAMIDISDGLLADLGHVAVASGVQVNVETSRLPVAAALREAAAWLSAGHPSHRTEAADSGTAVTAAPPLPKPGAGHSGPSVPLDGQPAAGAAGAAGSEFALALEWVLAGGEDHSFAATFPASAALPPRWHVVGEVREGTGVTVDNTPHTGPGGWQHFR